MRAWSEVNKIRSGEIISEYFDRDSGWLVYSRYPPANGKGEKLFIEFVVTHESSEEKRNSGTRIIELSLEDEDDLETIQQGMISQTNFKTEFHNFKEISKTRRSCPSCNKKLHSPFVCVH